ncbi:MAG TPA: ABC transporter ATP-binding protein [Coriobacteriia bacterium]|jgi:ABC-2 type transport system ATP-binding protein
MAEERSAIEVQGARKLYPARLFGQPRLVVDDVSLRVGEGTIHGLLGPNGAGKTTTLKMLLGLVRPSAGTFRVGGMDSTSPAGRASLGFLPEQPYFPAQLTATEALRLYGRLVGLARAEIRAETERLLALVGLEGRGHESLSRFSRGMLQRLGVAQALLGDPRVVVLDEPASGLDPIGQRDMRNLMLALRDEKRTVLLSSHQLSEVEAVCDRVTIVNRGRVAAEGHIDDLLSVAGYTSIRARGLSDPLPPALQALVEDVASSGGTWIFSVAEADVRRAVDLVDDAGGVVIAVNPKRDSLEDYFSRMLSARPETSSAEEVA